MIEGGHDTTCVVSFDLAGYKALELFWLGLTGMMAARIK